MILVTIFFSQHLNQWESSEVEADTEEKETGWKCEMTKTAGCNQGEEKSEEMDDGWWEGEEEEDWQEYNKGLK